MTRILRGKTLFISGGSRGIGVAATVEQFSGIDVCVNTASAIGLSGVSRPGSGDRPSLVTMLSSIPPGTSRTVPSPTPMTIDRHAELKPYAESVFTGRRRSARMVGLP